MSIKMVQTSTKDKYMDMSIKKALSIQDTMHYGDTSISFHEYTI